ncbi:MAG: serine/threonine protein kinase [Desulfobacterales bacterium]|nr:MAG: serine/threonine protein kinase [Desulfobacterales bacterium]
MVSIDTLDVSHLIGQKVGSSTILKELARGGMAIVFIAFQTTLKRQIAVKILPKSILTSKTAELFQQEAEAAAILSHPNIIPIYEVGETYEFLFFTMQLVQGIALSKHLKLARKNILPSKRTLPLKTTIGFINQILDALAHAHEFDIIHRDIKPDNVLIEKHTRRPIITDFGVAKVLRNENKNNSLVQGTPLYMAPEQIIGPQTDGRTDIYAVGTMLFEMLAPVLPLPRFDSLESLLKRKVLNKKGIFLKRPSEVNPSLHRDMDQIVHKALNYEPDQRYANCREFSQSLQDYQSKHL